VLAGARLVAAPRRTGSGIALGGRLAGGTDADGRSSADLAAVPSRSACAAPVAGLTGPVPVAAAWA
jgi:hypothetical protein